MKVKMQKKRRAPRASGENKLLRKPKGTEVVPGLTGYLVVWRHTMDDVPIGLFKTKTDAMTAAKKTSFRAGYARAKKLDIDCRTPVCFAVITFDNGMPTDMLVIDRPDDV
jgi:hypothetical protein